MSVHVNLLPREIEDRNRQRRQLSILVAAAAAVLLGLAGGYVWQLQQVADAEDRLAAENATLAAIQEELAQLDEFDQLQQETQLAGTILALGLGDEVTYAGVLQDIAAVIPPDTSITQLAVELDPASVEGDQEEDPAVALGTLTIEGVTLEGHAPGLERLLLELSKIDAFDDVYFSSSERNKDGYVEFSVDVQLGPELLTGRYLDGIPEELR